MGYHTVSDVLAFAAVMAFAATLGGCSDRQPTEAGYSRAPTEEQRLAALGALLDTVRPALPGEVTVTVVTPSDRGERGFSVRAIARPRDSSLFIKAVDNQSTFGLYIYLPLVDKPGSPGSWIYIGGAESRRMVLRLTSLDTTTSTMSGSIACEFAYCTTRGTIIRLTRCEDPFTVTVSFTDIPIVRRPVMSATIVDDSTGAEWKCSRVLDVDRYGSWSSPDVLIDETLWPDPKTRRFALHLSFPGPVRIGSHAMTGGQMSVFDESDSLLSNQNTGYQDSFNRIDITSIDSLRSSYSGTFQVRFVHDSQSNTTYTIRNGVFRDYPLWTG